MKPQTVLNARARPRLRRPQSIRALLGASACMAALMLSSGAAAQQGEVDLGEITVIGTRTEVSVLENPRSVSVVGQQQLSREAPKSIGDALRDVPGVELVDAGVPGMKRLRIRGESSRRVTVLIDGQEITDHSTYGTPILVNPANVERIDVVRGPTSVLWGAKAIGGVINIVTKKGAEGKEAELELGASYYSGTSGLQGWASVSGTVGDFDYRLTGGVSDHGDQKTPKGAFTSSGKLANTVFENDDLYAHLGFRLGPDKNHYLSFKAEQYRLSSENWSDPALITGNPATFTSGTTAFAINLPQRDRRKFGVYYDGEDLSDTVAKLHLDAYYQTVERLFENEVGAFVAPGGPTTITVDVAAESEDTLVNYGASAQVDLDLFPQHKTIVGVQYLADVLETSKPSSSTETVNAPGSLVTTVTENEGYTKARIDTLSVFAQDTWEILPETRLIAGARLNRIENTLEKNTGSFVETTTVTPPGLVFVTPGTPPLAAPGSSTDVELSTSLGLTYTGVQDTTFRALYSSGYISPTLLQLYSRTSAGGETVHGNPELELESADNFELGFRFDDGDFVIDAAGFYTKARDYITAVDCSSSAASCPAGAAAGDLVYVNVDEATTYGAELLLQYTAPGTRLTPYATGALTRRQIQYEDFSTYNTNTPLVSGRFGLRYEWDMLGAAAWADVFGRAASGVDETLPGDSGPVTTSFDGWSTLNLAFGATYGDEDQYRLNVQVNNITDVEYRPLTDALPGVGRSVDVTAVVKF